LAETSLTLSADGKKEKKKSAPRLILAGGEKGEREGMNHALIPAKIKQNSLRRQILPASREEKGRKSITSLLALQRKEKKGWAGSLIARGRSAEALAYRGKKVTTCPCREKGEDDYPLPRQSTTYTANKGGFDQWQREKEEGRRELRDN